MDEFVATIDEVENQLGWQLPVISGGSSNSLQMLISGQLSTRVNHLRIGDTIMTGRIANYGQPLPDGFADPFSLTAEIIEIKTKPSKPVGLRVPGQFPVAEDSHFPDLGLRRRALVAVGKQDVTLDHLTPRDPGISICGGSSDVTIVDITDSQTDYQVGDSLVFTLDYFSILPTMVSPFVEKRMI